MSSWRYAKGSHYERELLHKLVGHGFKVIRAAGSGVDGDSPDLIALSTTLKFALECKAYKDAVYVAKDKFSLYFSWEQSTGIPVYLAWKAFRKDWKFFPLSVLRETPKSYVVSESDWSTGLSFEDITGKSSLPNVNIA